MELDCNNCGAALLVEEHLRTIDCPYCASSSVVERPPGPDRPPPTFAIGFSVPLTAAREKVGHWLKSRGPFVVSAVKRAALESVRGVYVPAWLYSAVSESDYRAEIGENYTETETYTTTENGKTVTRQRKVNKTEWRPLSGRLAEYVPDVLVTASRGLRNEELERIEPFDLRSLLRYAPAVVAGWIAEEPTLGRDECLMLARREALARTEKRLRGFMPGDHHRALQHQTRLRDEALEPCLVPVWVMTARYHPDKPPVRVLVNGQTGALHGDAPLSWIKISSAVAIAAALVAAIVWLLMRT